MLVARVENEVERRFEPVRDFMLMGFEREIGRDYSQNRSYDIIGDGAVRLDRTDDIDEFRVQQDLLMRLPERRRDLVLSRIDPSARECDLSRMGTQVFAPDGENQAWAGPVGKGDQYGGRYVVSCGKVRKVAFERRFDCGQGQCFAQTIRERHSESSSGKKTPQLHTPGRSSPASSASSASS